MNDPYSVLGVSASASDEEIREAYRQLAARYTSSDYAGDPMAEVAAERMRELDAAYDAVMAQRRTGGNGVDASRDAGGSGSFERPVYGQSSSPNYGGFSPDGGARQGTGNYASGRQPAFSEIRLMLSHGDVYSAEQRLLAMNPSMRGAEWDFLMGNVCQRKGWLDEAHSYYAKAASAEPSNAEYAAAFNNMAGARAKGTSYTGYGAGRSASYCSDDCCSFLQCYCCTSMCLDSCCNCR